MKQFVFTLQAVLGFKQTTEKRQKAELAAAQAALEALRARERALDESFDRTAQSMARALELGRGLAEELPRHGAFFGHLRGEKAALRPKLEAAEAARRRCQQALIKTMNEIKTLENLRAEQLAEYQEEVRAEEAKEMADLVAYQAITADRR